LTDGLGLGKLLESLVQIWKQMVEFKVFDFDSKSKIVGEKRVCCLGLFACREGVSPGLSRAAMNPEPVKFRSSSRVAKEPIRVHRVSRGVKE
jgi:hypothetical protein